MNKQINILNEILRTTFLMNKGIVNKDIDLIEQMLDERQDLISKYDKNNKLSEEEKAVVDEFMALDKENNLLLKDLVIELGKEVESAQKSKADVTKKNRIAKRYLTDGQMGNSHSKFNRKT